MPAFHPKQTLDRRQDRQPRFLCTAPGALRPRLAGPQAPRPATTVYARGSDIGHPHRGVRAGVAAHAGVWSRLIQREVRHATDWRRSSPDRMRSLRRRAASPLEIHPRHLARADRRGDVAGVDHPRADGKLSGGAARTRRPRAAAARDRSGIPSNAPTRLTAGLLTAVWCSWQSIWPSRSDATYAALSFR